MSSTRNRNLAALIREIRRAIGNSILFNQRVADQMGLNYTDHQVLNLLDLHGRPTPGELAALTGLSTGGVTQSLDRLERAGWIRRLKNPGDRRSVFVRANPARRRAAEKFYKGVTQMTVQLLAPFSDRQIAEILGFFLHMNSLARPPAPGRKAQARKTPARRVSRGRRRS